ncbi:MAG: nucleotide pyrophosphatase, partial [Thermoplasmata archaeon]
VRYNDVIKDPRKEIERVNEFLGGMLNVSEAVKAVDPKLYRNVRER